METKLVKFLPEHAQDIIERNQKGGKIMSLNVNLDECIEMWANKGPGYTLIIDDVIVGSAGIVSLGWRRGEAWMLISSAFYQYKKTTYKIIKGMLELLAKSKDLKRVQSFIFCDLDAEVRERFLRHLGFEKEGILRCAGPDNENLAVFSRIF